MERLSEIRVTIGFAAGRAAGCLLSGAVSSVDSSARFAIVVFLRTSLRSSWSPFPGKSDFGAQRQNGHKPWKQSARNPETKLTRWNAPIWGYLAPPQEISAVRRLIGGATRTRTMDPLVEGRCLALAKPAVIITGSQ
jgi:hypothetical protein